MVLRGSSADGARDLEAFESASSACSFLGDETESSSECSCASVSSGKRLKERPKVPVNVTGQFSAQDEVRSW